MNDRVEMTMRYYTYDLLHDRPLSLAYYTKAVIEFVQNNTMK